MRSGPCLAVPGKFSPPEEIETSIHAECELLMEDPELQEALYDLSWTLAHALTESHEDLAWEAFTDTIEKLRLRAHSHLIHIAEEPDYEEHA